MGRISARGHMWAADRPVDSSGPAIRTPTSPAYDGGSFEADPPEDTDIPDLVPGLEAVDLFWNDRLVHRTMQHKHGPRFIAADDWDNCRDERFLAYIDERAARLSG